MNNCAPKIDPCGTPWNISRYELKLDLVLTLCFLPVRQSNIKLSALISKFSAGSFTTRMSCVLQSNAFDKKSAKCSSFIEYFLAFSIMVIRACWMLYFFAEAALKIKACLPFGLIDYKWDTHKFLKMRVRYSLVNSWLYFLWFSSLKKGLTPAFF